MTLAERNSALASMRAAGLPEQRRCSEWSGSFPAATGEL